MNFKEYLEYDPNEQIKVKNLNMTSNLPNISIGDIGKLTRGFHLNTIIGRMMQPWNNILVGSQKNKILGISSDYLENGIPNKKFMAAYDLFKNEIANAISNLPYKKGKDIRTGSFVDVLAPSKDFLSNYDVGGEFLSSLDKALNISLIVLPRHLDQISNFINFLEIVRDEFMTIGEKLPSMKEFPLEKINTNDIGKKIKKYEILRKKYYKNI